MPQQGEVFSGGPTTSQHVDAEDADHFENTSFKLKRTRLMGLLDDFIAPDHAHSLPCQGKPHTQTPNVGCQSSTAPSINPHDDFDMISSVEYFPVTDGTITSSEVSLSSLLSDDQSAEDDHKLDLAGPSVPSNLPLSTYKDDDLAPHDDCVIAVKPSSHVDYLSHQWDVSDISKSWRYIISRRKDVANSARLENASWRTWAQRRSNLKTINPEVVNWSKDSDVTWLYGPILKDESDFNDENPGAPSTATSVVAGDISLPKTKKQAQQPWRKRGGPKPILKHRTVEAMIISQSNLLKLEMATNKMYQLQREKRQAQIQQRQHEQEQSRLANKTPEFYDYDAISAKLNAQYKDVDLAQSNSVTNLQDLLRSKRERDIRMGNNSAKPSSCSLAEDMAHAPAGHVASAELQEKSYDNGDEQASLPSHVEQVDKSNRHIHFNDEVMQCMAINNYADSDTDDNLNHDANTYYYDDDGNTYYPDDDKMSASDEEDDDNDDDDDEDDDGFFLNFKASGASSLSAVPVSTADNDDEAIGGDAIDESDAASCSSAKSYMTIQLLPPTTINYGSSDEESDDEQAYATTLNHNTYRNNSTRGYDYRYDYNTVYEADPNHEIYGKKSSQIDVNPPTNADVVDVPDNIALGSSFDYDAIETEHYSPSDSTFAHHNAEPSPEAHGPLSRPLGHMSDSSDDDDDNDGLSIGARRSSHSLAQVVFGGNSYGEVNHFPKRADNHVSSAPISIIKPSQPNTSISKQPASSSSLSTLFQCGNGMGLSKSKNLSNHSLADQFFNSVPSKVHSHIPDAHGHDSTGHHSQNKCTTLAPHTTSANAFLAAAAVPHVVSTNRSAPSRGGFLLNSDSESEDEFIENVSLSAQPVGHSARTSLPTPESTNWTWPGPGPSHSTTPAPVAVLVATAHDRNGQHEHPFNSSYASLSQVAGKSGIASPATDSPSRSHQSLVANSRNSSKTNLVDQAKEFANHLLGSWKSNAE